MTTASTESRAYAALFAAIGPIVEYYRDDLLVHDRRMIELASDETPFISAARETGTDLWPLFPADHSNFPARGERVPYLFGTADREHIARGTVSGVHHSVKSNRVLHYWNGRTLRRIDGARATAIASAWLAGVLAAWKR